MKSTNKLIIILIVLLIISGLMGYFVYRSLNPNQTSTSSDTTEVTPVTDSTEVSVEYNESEIADEYTNYTAKIDLNNLSSTGNGVNISENTITIQSAGTYYLSGTANANIVVNAEKQQVILVLDNVNLTSTNTSAINVIKAKEVIINSAKGSTNTITDSSNYTVFTEDDEPDGCIFSKADLVINGLGKLVVKANYQDGVVSKDTLKIINTNIEITSADDGIRGKDYVSIKNSSIQITSTGDGIKATNTETDTGFVAIDGGTITLNSKADGIQAETYVNIANEPTINITTSGTVSTVTSQFGTSSTDDGTSSKGIKAGSEITIESGNIKISSTDDAIHSNGYIIINNGNLELSSGDDGIHADNNIQINNGTINIIKAYEGIESSYIEINGGKITVKASDDGVNVCGGNDQSAFNRAGANSFTSSSNGKLIITGGEIFVDSTGDGLDSNGSIEMSGGNVVVSGPTQNGNGPLDYDASFNITGGSLIIYGSNGMWQSTSNTSTQYSVVFAVSGKSGDKLELKDSSGNTVLSTTTNKTYAQILFSSNSIKKGETYTLYVNGTQNASLTANSVVTSNGTTGMGGGMQGDMQQGERMRR